MTNNDRDIASAVRSALADRIGIDRFTMWFDADTLVTFDDNRLIVTVAGQFFAERLQRGFREELAAVARDVVGAETRIEFRVDSAAVARIKSDARAAADPSASPADPSCPSKGDAKRIRESSAVSESTVSESTVSESTASKSTVSKSPASKSTASKSTASKSTVSKSAGSKSAGSKSAGCVRADGQAGPSGFTNADCPAFILGDEHAVAQASLEMILRQPGKMTPLFVHGPTGCGKSRFLDHARREARQRVGMRRIVSVSAEQFTTQFLEALQGKGMPSFRRKFRDVELLLIDDLQFFNGKKQTLGELQATIDYLLREHRQLILAADRSPYELAAFSSDLVGRLRGGVVCALPYPNLRTRRGIAEQLANQHGGLPADVLDLIASRLQGDARQIVGAVYRLLATGQARGIQLNAASAEEALDDLFRAAIRTVRLTDIEEAVCDVFGVDKQLLHTEDRRKHVSQPRMLAMWLARKHTRAGPSEICRYFGKRSHSTVVSAERQVRRWLDQGTAVRLLHGDFPIEDAIRRVESQLRTG